MESGTIGSLEPAMISILKPKQSGISRNKIARREAKKIIAILRSLQNQHVCWWNRIWTDTSQSCKMKTWCREWYWVEHTHTHIIHLAIIGYRWMHNMSWISIKYSWHFMSKYIFFIAMSTSPQLTQRSSRGRVLRATRGHGQCAPAEWTHPTYWQVPIWAEEFQIVPPALVMSCPWFEYVWIMEDWRKTGHEKPW